MIGVPVRAPKPVRKKATPNLTPTSLGSRAKLDTQGAHNDKNAPDEKPYRMEKIIVLATDLMPNRANKRMPVTADAVVIALIGPNLSAR